MIVKIGVGVGIGECEHDKCFPREEREDDRVDNVPTFFPHAPDAGEHERVERHVESCLRIVGARVVKKIKGSAVGNVGPAYRFARRRGFNRQIGITDPRGKGDEEEEEQCAAYPLKRWGVLNFVDREYGAIGAYCPRHERTHD